MTDAVLHAAPVAPAARRTRHPTAWWGTVMMITTESVLFAGLLSSFFFLRASTAVWPPEGVPVPELRLISIFTVVLLGSSIPVVLAERRLRQGHRRACGALLAVAFVMGAAFLAHQGYEYWKLEYGWGDHAYGSIFYTTTGLHGLHVFVALLMSIVVQLKLWTGRIDEHRHLTMQVYGMYWHFVDAVWVFVFASLYLSEHL